MKTSKVLGYEINSKSCGCDKDGVFHCRCGKCKVLNTEVSHNSDNRSNDCGYGGNDRNDGIAMRR